LILQRAIVTRHPQNFNLYIGMPPRIQILFGVLSAAFLVSCEKAIESQDSASFEKFDSPWAHEEHWMVAGTVRDLQGMLKLRASMRWAMRR
jgi:hypothetical protein